MNRVKVTPRKKRAFAFAVGGVSVGVIALVALVAFLGGFTGGVAYNARPMMIGSEYGGYVVDKPSQEQFIKSLGPNASVRGAEPDLFTTALPTEVRLDLAMRKASEKAGRGPYRIIRQEIGDCFVKGTVVLGEKVKPIEDVRVGDRVWTAEGKLTTVVSTRRKLSSSPLVTVRATGTLPITCTPDHRFLVYRMARVAGKRVTSAIYSRAIDPKSNVASKTRVKNIYEARQAEWVAAKDLCDTDYLLTPVSVDVSCAVPCSPGGIASTSAGMYALGYFLGDGHASIGTVEFALSDEVLSTTLAGILRTHGFIPKDRPYRDDCGAWRLRVHSRELVNWLRSQFYDSDNVKVFPAWALKNSDFLQGLQDADGSKSGLVNRLDSTSKSIIYGAYFSLIEMGFEPTVCEVCRAGGSYENAKPLYRLTWREQKQKSYIWRDSNFVCRPVIRVDETGECDYVWDIGVEDEHHSFIADGVSVHNCVSHGFARAIECAWAIEYLDGRVTEWWQVSPESVYAGRIDTGWRWLNSDGWNGSSAAKYTKNFGVLLKKRYESGSNVLDLTTYNGNRALTFGARGLPAWIKPEAKKHLVKEVALVTSVSEAKASLANGYPIAFCTGLGFKPVPVQRDQNGVARQNGEWGHCWSALGYFTLPNGKVAFVTYNNWGETSTTGPGGPQNIPPGAFAIHESDFARILSERDSYAVSGPYGFERRDLDHDTWAEHWSKESEFQFVVAP